MKRLNFLKQYAKEGVHYSLDKEHKRIMDEYDTNPEKVIRLLKEEPISSENIHHLLDKNNPDMIEDIAFHSDKIKNLNSSHIDKIINSGYRSAKYVLGHPLVTTEHINKALDAPSNDVNRYAAKNCKSPENVQKVLDGPYGPSIKAAAISSGRASDEQLKWAADFKNHGHTILKSAADTELELNKMLDEVDLWKAE